jgi:DNA-binding NarL/FixJ family response regulator
VWCDMEAQNGDFVSRRRSRRIQIAVAARRSLDLEGLTRVIQHSGVLSLVASESELTKISEACEIHGADLALLDATFPDAQAFDVGRKLLSRGHVRAVAFLDDDFTMVRAQRALAIPDAAYFTRNDTFAHIIGGIGELLGQPQLAGGDLRCSEHVPTPKYLLRAEHLRAHNTDGFLDLSCREQEVLSVLASGYTARKAARVLNVTESTVGNHKTRIMKKLKITHATQLTRVAMRAGLID